MSCSISRIILVPFNKLSAGIFDLSKTITITGFDDTTPNLSWTHVAYRHLKPMTEEQAKNIVARVVAIDGDTVIISCAENFATIAPAVAIAIAEWQGLEDTIHNIYHSYSSLPNGHVLRLMRKALGTHKEGEHRERIEQMYSKLFMNRVNPWNQEER